MSTRATATVKGIAVEWEKLFKSAVTSGIVGDARHRAQGGYHISRQDQPSGNYSVTRPDDRKGPADAAAAIDMTLSTADMKTCTRRLVAAYADPADPRRKYINAFNGWLGGGSAQRWDVYARVVSWATPDHKWHVHLEIRRAYVDSATAARAILSVLRGESVAEYLRSIGVSTAVKPVPAARRVPAYPGRLLVRNDRQARPDPAVKQWQLRVVERGWTSIGKPDGYFGPRTESVVKRFQNRHKLAVDGKIGPQTWACAWTCPGPG